MRSCRRRQRQLQGCRVVCRFRDLGGRVPQHLQQVAEIAVCGGFEAIQNALAGAAIFHQPGLFELSQMGRYAALTHGQDFLKLGDGQLFPLQ